MPTMKSVSVNCGDVPLYKSPVVCYDAEVVYLQIGKVASNSIKRSLDGRWDFITKDFLVLEYPDWPRVAVIRDPLERLESAYRYFKGKQSLVSPFPDNSFDQFVRAVYESPDDVTDCHLRSQVALLSHAGEFLPTVLISMEDLPTITQHLPISKLEERNSTTKIPNKIPTHWSEELKQLAQDRYAADLRLRATLTS